MSKGNRNNGKFAQDGIIAGFARDRKSSIKNSAVMQCKDNAKRNKWAPKKEVQISYAKDVFGA